MSGNFTKTELFHRYFSRILSANFIWQLSELLFLRTTFLPKHLHWQHDQYTDMTAVS